MIVRPDGPIPARCMIVGEAPGADEERQGIPFVGASGMELNKMLGEAGIGRNECFLTNVCRTRPPSNDINQYFAQSKKARTSAHSELYGRWVTREIVDGVNLLHKEIEAVNPNIIVALGNTPLWALTGKSGITKWRGSMLYFHSTNQKVKPTFPPAAVLREWSWRAITLNDLRRAKRFINGEPYPTPKWNFIT